MSFLLETFCYFHAPPATYLLISLNVVNAHQWRFCCQLAAASAAAVTAAAVQFMVMLKDVIDSPTNQTFSKWMEHPNLGSEAGALWKSMQAARAARGQL
jgi:hypothetical protein